MKIEKNSLFFLFFMPFLQNFTDFSQFQKKYEGIFGFYRKSAFLCYKKISSSIIFSYYRERIQILNKDVKVNDNFDFKWLWSSKIKPEIGLPQFFFNFKVYLIEKSWGTFVRKNVHLPSKNGLWPMN